MIRVKELDQIRAAIREFLTNNHWNYLYYLQQQVCTTKIRHISTHISDERDQGEDQNFEEGQIAQNTLGAREE